ncbi:hypothetical protein CYMTET_8149 [Cymbomonas tetramitiformis]|uniref:Glycosyltransferase n=1 Tax=Cymbomonas tetramitiformis TaxID=36881 RepID=A0AAE0LGD2_9CHLO|nr:hypothetical protein CYMTET_8149 [Cymbomonas tetramitiformis]
MNLRLLFFGVTHVLQVFSRRPPSFVHDEFRLQQAISHGADASDGFTRRLLYSSRGLNRANRARAAQVNKDNLSSDLVIQKSHAQAVGGNKNKIKLPAGHPGLQLASVQGISTRNGEEIARGLDPDKGTTGKGHAYYEFLKTGHQPNKAQASTSYLKHIQAMQDNPAAVALWHKRVDQHAKKQTTGDRGAQAYHKSQPLYHGFKLGNSSSGSAAKGTGPVHTKSPENMVAVRAAASQAASSASKPSTKATTSTKSGNLQGVKAPAKDSAAKSPSKAPSVANILPSLSRQPSLAELPSFVFPEEGHRYFGHNVLGLNISIQESINQGCLDGWSKGNMQIEIIFEAKLQPKMKRWIQFQMEQLASGWFTRSYIYKLTKASQLWSFSPRDVDQLQQMTGRDVVYVPLWHTLDRSFLDPGFREQAEGMYGSDETKTVFLGSINPRRGEICSRVKETVRSRVPVCLDLWGEYAVGAYRWSQAVFSMNFYPNSSLEVHRLNPILALERPVISTRSGDAALNRIYEQQAGVIFVDTVEEIPEELLKLLGDQRRIRQLRRRAEAFIRKSVADLGPLCSALQALVRTANEENW